MPSLVLERERPSTVRQIRILGSDVAGAAPDEATLIERMGELDVLERAVARVAGRAGGVVVLEAPAGLGKTALLEHAAELAAQAGCLVRRAAPGQLERQFPFGVVRTLLEAPLRDASRQERAHLLRGPATIAGGLLLDGTLPDDATGAIVAHSVLWLCTAIARERPLAMIVDDAHWADRGSLEVLSYLARRIEDVPVLIVVGARGEYPGAAADLLSLLGGVRCAAVLHPQPLTPTGAVRLIHRLAPDTPIPTCRECHRAAEGNPWLLGELARQIAASGLDVIHDPRCGARPPVTAVGRNVVRRRLAELVPRDRDVASALAVALVVAGDGATPQVARDGATPQALAAIAGVPVGELSAAREGLAAAGLLAGGGERLAHDLIAAAIVDDLAPTERERLHREAARALMHTGAPSDVVAGHLLRCAPDADSGVSELLQRAASDAAQRGEPGIAATYLERALSERAAGEDRGSMLTQLAACAFDAGRPDSGERLLEALRETRDRAGRIDVLTRLAGLRVSDSADGGVGQLLEEELADGADPVERLALEAAALDALTTMPGSQTERARRAGALQTTSGCDPFLERAVLAHRSWLATELGAPDAEACGAAALDALDGDVLLTESWRRLAYHLCVRALVMTDRSDAARRAIAAIREVAVDRGSLRLRAAADWYAAELALRTGRVVHAENHARLALGDGGTDRNAVSGGAIEVLLGALAERGAFEPAHELLRERELCGRLGRRPWEIGVLHARARLWLAEGDFERAHADACEAGALREQQGRPNPTWTPWRSTAALALSHLGRCREAAVLAETELVLAERFGAPVPVARALHACAVAQADDFERVTLCNRALAVLAGSEAVLESVRLRLVLGSTLSYIGRRVSAREALRPALADADAVGAVPLAQRARRELVATGLRPRRAAIEGAEALTPRQRQICELAAQGKANRAIAHQLFLSIKTVETHLAAGYRKLGVRSRTELAPELAG